MKTKSAKASKGGISWMFLVLVAVLADFAASRVSAQNYSIDWFTIDGGGGTSTGGVYSVSGTIGQPDAGHMSGGEFTLYCGFLGDFSAVPNPRAPLFWIFFTRFKNLLGSSAAPFTRLFFSTDRGVG